MPSAYLRFTCSFIIAISDCDAIRLSLDELKLRQRWLKTHKTRRASLMRERSAARWVVKKVTAVLMRRGVARVSRAEFCLLAFGKRVDEFVMKIVVTRGDGRGDALVIHLA